MQKSASAIAGMTLCKQFSIKAAPLPDVQAAANGACSQRKYCVPQIPGAPASLQQLAWQRLRLILHGQGRSGPAAEGTLS